MSVMFPVDALTLLTFVPAALALNLTPGADMMFSLGQGLRSGPRAAVAAAAGITAGGMVHVTLAGLGLGALVAAHPGLFDLIRWVGVAYLLWLAVQSLRHSALARSTAPALAPLAAFRDGALVNLTNPKVILFVLAFIPQFVDPARGAVLVQFLIFGAVLGMGGMIVNSAVGIFAAGLGRHLATSPQLSRNLGRISAGIFAALALRLALLQKV
ncbi:LysE family translocator [Pseudorhodobacter ferrugineus]|uniref:LysE family translocator n=1 Tax=Pseudorhodobacter ferrugineus TaxID=77008 RepID=UPI0003B3E97E|nr:LysE family translocator [Pseudorhodobacter ferrugineus]